MRTQNSVVFYNPVLSTVENAKLVIQIVEKYNDNELILWKGLLCLSAFPTKESQQFLLKYSDENTIFGKEARRSLYVWEKSN